MRTLLKSTLACLLLLASAVAGAQSSSSSSRGARAPEGQGSSSTPRSARAGQPEAAGAAITLETSEPLFDLAVALNACGYDADLTHSSPVRTEVRAEVDAAVAASPAARVSRDALCEFIEQHKLTSAGQGTAQYVSLGLYLGPPPALTPTADETEIPPDALAVVTVLPLLRSFSEAVQLHSIWLRHRAAYEALTDTVHEPLTRMILNTNIYLRVPASSYDGRQFLVLAEPMLSPAETNARIYGSDYTVVVSPNPSGAIRMDQVRHMYLHYVIEPLIYARASSMTRLQPLLKPVQDAPLDYTFKTDVIALVTECLIKGIEARTLDTGLQIPAKPHDPRVRAEQARYDEEMSAYQRNAEAIRRKQVDLDMRQGWILVEYFYNQLVAFEHESVGLREQMGEMVYGMDVGREAHHATEIAFLPEGSGENVRRVPHAPTGLALAEKRMLEGDLPGARGLAEKALSDPAGDHAEAEYTLARVDLMENEPEASLREFGEVLANSRNPRTLAWAHIYRGRLLDTHTPPERTAALGEYKAALSIPAAPADARAAAEQGLRTAFSVPRTAHMQEDDEPLDPTGKAEKESYRPDEPQTPPTPAPPTKPRP